MKTWKEFLAKFMRLVLDTNIYLASLLQDGLCRGLTQYVFNLKNGHEVCISKEINLELFKKIAQKKEVSSSNSLDWLTHQINEVAIFTIPQEKIVIIKRDPDDDKILECAAACKADLIITMDHHLLKLKTFRTTGIIHPKTFLHIVEK